MRRICRLRHKVFSMLWPIRHGLARVVRARRMNCARARHAAPATLGLWISEMLRVLRDKGSITLALPAAAYGEAVFWLRPLCGGISLLPLWPRWGEKAKVILLQAQKASHAPDSILPGLILHDENGITPEAEAILRGGKALTIG